MMPCIIGRSLRQSGARTAHPTREVWPAIGANLVGSWEKWVLNRGRAGCRVARHHQFLMLDHGVVVQSARPRWRRFVTYTREMRA